MKVREILSELGVRPGKKRGQNFLVNPDSAQQLIRFAELVEGERVLEVGPGLGALTRVILEITKDLDVVELEPQFVSFLQTELFPGATGRVFHCDILEFDLNRLQAFPESTEHTLVSNVPYSISSEFVLWLLAHSRHFSSASLLLQREFAERLAAGPGTKAYGSLSVASALYYDVSLGPILGGSSFYPKADVESRAIRFVRKTKEETRLENFREFETVVRACFSHRRKTILNSLVASNTLGDKERVSHALSLANIDVKCRAETLSLEDFIKLVLAFREAK